MTHRARSRRSFLASLGALSAAGLVAPDAWATTPRTGALASPLLTYVLPDNVESAAFSKRMREKHDVQLKVVPKQWLNGNRVSTHLFNNEQDNRCAHRRADDRTWLSASTPNQSRRNVRHRHSQPLTEAHMRDIFAYLGLGFIPVSVTLTALWLSARSRANKAEAVIREIALSRSPRDARRTPLDSQMTDALDAIALEVERIAEGQRFTTKLLSDRREYPASSQSQGRVNTPH